jgi:hypothetical protein
LQVAHPFRYSDFRVTAYIVKKGNAFAIGVPYPYVLILPIHGKFLAFFLPEVLLLLRRA